MSDITELVNNMTNMYITQRTTTEQDPLECLMESFEKLNINKEEDNYNITTLIDEFNNLSVEGTIIKPYINEIIAALTLLCNKRSCASIVKNNFCTPNWIY